MKPYKLKTLLFYLTLCIFSFKSYSQNGIYFKWFSQVGCYEFSSDEDRMPLEDIEDDLCFKACENSQSKYQLIFDDHIDVQSIQWNVTGSDSYSSGFDSLNVTWGDGPANASINVIITLENGEIINKNICFDIINSPEAAFEFLIDQIHNCSDSPINFINNSVADPGDEIVSYQWDFGDGNTSNEFEPSHTYTSTGFYNVTLTVVNDCNCTDTFEMGLELTGSALSIECPTVVCEGQTDVYHIDDANEECSGYLWDVIGGEIIGDNSDDTVEIVWNNVDDDGFGYVLFDHVNCNGGSDFCNDIISEKIPVIQNNGTIKGETNICQNEQYKYTLPQWPTTDFQWKLLNGSGQNFDNNLVLVDQRNQIVVDTENLPAGNYTLISDYINTLLGCGGNATLSLDVNQQAHIDGPQIVCSEEEIIFEEISGITNLDWQILFNGENYPIEDQNNNQMVAVFEEPGLYSIIVEANDLCQNENFVVEVKEKPNTPSGNIVGPIKVCKNEPIVYSYDGTISEEHFLKWDVQGGNIQGSITGQEVTIIFDEPGVTDFQITAGFVDKDVQSCISSTIVLDVIEDPIDVEIININDESTFCPSTISSEFQVVEQATGNLYEIGEVYEWTVEPVEFASIESGNLTNTVKVNFNEINFDDFDDPITQGELKLQVKRCGVFHTVQSIPIHKYLFDFDLVTPDICRNDTFDITVNSSLPINPSESGSVILRINGDNMGSNPVFTNNNQTITFENISLSPENIEITQNVSVSFNTPNGCKSTSVSDSFDILDTPLIETDPSGYIYLCDDEAFNETFTASIISGGGTTNSYQWFENGIPMTGEINPTLNFQVSAANVMSLDGNTYYVEVTNEQTGCSDVSEDINIIVSDCVSSPVCIFSDGDLDLDWMTCNTFSAQAINIPTGYTSLHWSISGPGDNEAVASGQGTLNATFSMTEIGTYTIGLRGEYPDCRLILSETIVKGYKPRLSVNVSCNATNDGYEVTLKNISDYYPDFEPTSTSEVDFFLNGSPIANDPGDLNSSQSVSIPQGLDQELSMEIQQTGSPVCISTKSIDIPAFPNASFTLESPQCTENAFFLSPDAPIDDIYTYTWSFLGTENLQAEHAISMPTSLDEEIELTVTGPFGCSATTSLNIEVDEADFDGGFITGEGIFCNSLTTLLYQNQANTPVDYQWMRGYELIANETNSSYQPTQSGSYWVQVFNANGCVDDTDPVNVTYVTPPEANVDAPLTACVGEDFSINGFALSNGVEYQWIIDGNETGWESGFPAVLSQNISNTGSVSYSFQVRFTDNPTCLTDINFEVDIVQPAAISVIQTQEYCSPYTVKLQAIGGDPNGVYNWSNGSINNPVEVNHGGPYRLTYIPPDGGCETVVDIDVPKSPDEFIWIFPEGCIDYCRFGEDPYLIGPIPEFGAYQWIDDAVVVDSGNDAVVPDLVINDGMSSNRNLQLSLSNNNCTVTSDILDVNLILCQEGCESIEFNISNVILFSEPFEFYELYGSITNTYSVTTTFIFTATNGDGIFNPSSITLAPGQTYNFSPLVFIPNSNFTGGAIDISVKHQQLGETICLSDYSVRLSGESQARSEAFIESVSPNPFQQNIQVDLHIPDDLKEQTFMLKVYDIQGRKHFDHNIDNTQSSQNLQVENLPLGQFILTLEIDGKLIDQKHLIKE